MKWQVPCICLTLALFAAPTLAIEAVPFAGFAGLVLGNPGVPVVDVPAKSFVALYALAEYGGPTRIGAMCEIEGQQAESGKSTPSGSFVVTVSLVRHSGPIEKIARFRMRLRDGVAEASRLREMFVQPGDYLLFKFRHKGKAQLTHERVYVYVWAGAPDLRFD